MDRRTILKRLLQSGVQVAPDALEFIMTQESPLTLVETLLNGLTPDDTPSVLTADYIEPLLKGKKPRPSSTTSLPDDVQEEPTELIEDSETTDIEFESKLTESDDWQFKILKNPDYENVGSEGTVEDFLALVSDRFRRIRRIYMSRIDTQNAIPPTIAKENRVDSRRRRAMSREGMRVQKAPPQMVLGMIKSKSISRSRNVVVEIEDMEGSLICVIPSNREDLKGKELSIKGNALQLDEVTCISGTVDQDGRMIAQDVIFPDIPTAREIGRSKRDVYAMFISDIHAGSHEFLADEFDRFIAWLSGRDVDSSEKEIVEQARYLFIAGDLIDGIGVYPGQKEDLQVSDVYDQYTLIADRLKKLPSHIKIICIPGNHDACRQALPKPPIPDDFAKSLYALGNRITMLGDPCQVQVEGVNILITHGDSLDDLVTTIPGASYKEPAIPMKELLKKRHLAPLYGGKTELAPLHRDWMVIDTPPDIVHFGHAHHNAVDNYRGVQIINSGTFQSQTDFMRKQGVIPTPGIVTYVNLRTGAPGVKMFYDMSNGTNL